MTSSVAQSIQVVVNPAPIQTTVATVTPPPSITVGTPSNSNVMSTSTETVQVQELGIIGPAGPPGDAPLAFPLVAASSWTKVHAYPYLPEVRLVDSSGEAVEIGVEYPASNTVSISFPVPFTGTVYLS